MRLDQVVDLNAPAPATTPSSSTTSTSITTSTSAAVSPAATPIATTSTAASARTLDGSVVSTRYGNVQVRITVAGGKVTAADAIQHPTGESDAINSAAIPVLNRRAVVAQSAQIDSVSGATYTSEAYKESLQSAIDILHV